MSLREEESSGRVLKKWLIAHDTQREGEDCEDQSEGAGQGCSPFTSITVNTYL